ncbi:MAG: hypothetical protein O3B64_01770 [bacterium]|nr:hypothetical protein [bacterium]MDA1024360.1 hypothetical protein [bacterium]
MATYKIEFGDKVIELPEGAENTQDFEALLQLLGVVVTVKVRPTRVGARTIGPLMLLPVPDEPKKAPQTQTADNLPSNPRALTKVEALSQSVGKLEISVRLQNILSDAGFVYVWHIAEKSEAEIRKTKGIGTKLLREIKRVLDDFALNLDMDIAEIRDQLPGN